MPRLSNEQYLIDAHNLRYIWLEHHGQFANVSPNNQWLLHAFFQPSKDWTDVQRLAHRREISVKRTSLPQQAGRGPT